MNNFCGPTFCKTWVDSKFKVLRKDSLFLLSVFVFVDNLFSFKNDREQWFYYLSIKFHILFYEKKKVTQDEIKREMSLKGYKNYKKFYVRMLSDKGLNQYVDFCEFNKSMIFS